jgi:signal transduction histidine kinase
LDFTIAVLVDYQDGVAGRGALLFIIPILATAFVFSRRLVYAVAVFAGLLYMSVEYAETVIRNTTVKSSDEIMSYVFYPLIFMVVAKLANQLFVATTSEIHNQSFDSFLANATTKLIEPASQLNTRIDQIQKFEQPSEASLIIKNMKVNNRRILQQLNNLLEATTNTKFATEEEIDLNAILKTICTASAETFNRSNDLHLDLGKSRILVFANTAKIITAIVNILNNAFQYTSPGSKVTITLRKSASDALIVIEDSGSGIEKKRIDRLFEKYSLQKVDTDGAGLGLFVSRKIIQAHRGSFHIFSSQAGTRVMIKLKRGRYHL